MTSQEHSPDESLSLPVLERIDRMCLKFEAAWKQGPPPRVEDYLRGAGGEERTHLLRELLALDVDYRRRAHHPLTEEEYTKRFRGNAHLVAEVFEQASEVAAPSTSKPRTDCATDRNGLRSTMPELRSSAAEAAAPKIARQEGRRFLCLRGLAKGGLGEVFVAYDQELNRQVAVKEIQQHHAGSAQNRARFTQEAEVTGGLEHPGIVPVYGLGAYADGRPYYAMRLIRGESLQEALGHFHEGRTPPERRAPAREFRKLLTRFVDVCQTIAYAHSRGVLHRDIKPSNIMLGRYGETLVVDWGLAKAIGGEANEDGDEPLLCPGLAQPDLRETAPGAAIGTPAYMSPEQAARGTHPLDQRSDVYSLGATLYTILAGVAPFTNQKPSDVLCKVKTGQFPPPRSIRPQVPRALEAICLKAMAVVPEERYASADEMAEDVEAWLANESVTAYRAPVSERMRRWLYRHQTLSLATTAGVLVAIVCLGIGMVLLAAANQREQVAKRRAEERSQLALDAIKGYYTGVSEDVILKQPQLTSLREKLLQVPLRFYEQMIEELGDEEALETRDTLAEAYHAIADISGQIGSPEQSLEAYGHELAILEQLVDEQPRVSAHRRRLCDSLAMISIQQNSLGRTDLAWESNQLAIRYCESFEKPSPEDRTLLAKLYNDMASFLIRRGDFQEAVSRLETAITIQSELVDEFADDVERRRNLARHYHNLASARSALGHLEAALEDHRKAVVIQEQLDAENPDMLVTRLELARGYHCLSAALLVLNATAESVAYQRRATQIHQSLADEFSNHFDVHWGLLKQSINLARLLDDTGRPDEAIEYLGDAQLLGERLAQDHPDMPHLRLDLITLYHNLGMTYRRLRQVDKASEAYDKALEHDQRLTEIASGFPEALRARALLYHSVGRMHREGDRFHEAVPYYENAARIHQDLAARQPASPQFRGDASAALTGLGLLQFQIGEFEAARASYDKAIALGEELVVEQPQVVSYAEALGGAYCNKGRLLRSSSDFAESIQCYDLSIGVLAPLLDRGEHNRRARLFLRNASCGRAASLCSLERYAEAVSDMDRAILAMNLPHDPCRMERTRVRALAGDHATAAEEAEQTTSKDNASGLELYNAACALSLASTAVVQDEELGEERREELSAQYKAKALVSLRNAQRAKYFDSPHRVQHLREDSDLDPLRQLAEFREWMQQLQPVDSPHVEAEMPGDGDS